MIVSHVHLDALTDDDVLVVQDFLDTKTTHFLARAAPIGEWRSEYATLEKASGERWNRNLFLLDYTLARHIASDGGLDGAPGQTGGFVQRFVDAVSRAEAARAKEIWLAERLHKRTTVLLLAALTAGSRGSELTHHNHALPAPFSSVDDGRS